MTTFRCPKCKKEIASTRYINIIKVICKGCKCEMIKLHKPTKLILQKEKELNLKFQNKYKGLNTLIS